MGEGPDGAAAVLHLPLSDVAVLAQSPFSTTGCATAMGEPTGDCGVGVLRGDGRGDGGGGHGGKDLLWMAAKVGEEVVSVYAGCPDISLTVTPDIKHAGRSSLVLVDLSGGHARLGTGADLQAAGRRIARLRHGAAEACLPRDPASAARVRAAGGPRPLGRRCGDEGAGDVLLR